MNNYYFKRIYHVQKIPRTKSRRITPLYCSKWCSQYSKLEPFLTDPNQAIRVMVAMNPDADAEILDRFANDKFWGVRIEVVGHPNVSEETLRRLFEA